MALRPASGGVPGIRGIGKRASMQVEEIPPAPRLAPLDICHIWALF